MTDSELVLLFLPIIEAGLVAQGYSSVVVKQSYQPTIVGANSGPTAYFYKAPQEELFGFPNKVYSTDGTLTETQIYRSKMRVTTLVRQNPMDVVYTASDLLSVIASILQSDVCVFQLIANGVGILGIPETQNPIFVDDFDEFEYASYFEFTLTYSRAIVTTGQLAVTQVNVDINVI